LLFFHKKRDGLVLRLHENSLTSRETVEASELFCLGILQGLVYDGRREPFENVQDLKNTIKCKWN